MQGLINAMMAFHRMMCVIGVLQEQLSRISKSSYKAMIAVLLVQKKRQKALLQRFNNIYLT